MCSVKKVDAKIRKRREEMEDKEKKGENGYDEQDGQNVWTGKCCYQTLTR